MRAAVSPIMRARTADGVFRVSHLVALAAAGGVGAAAMYLLDPFRGRRRRAQLRDQVVAVEHDIIDGVVRGGRDLQHRGVGLIERARALFEHEPITDDILHERVRAAIGRVVSHPGSIDVAVVDSVVTLRGPVLEREERGLVDAVERVHGVRGVRAELEAHETGEHVPGLQGKPSRDVTGRRIDVMQENWAPGTRLLAVVLGVGLVVYAAKRRRVLGGVLGMAGACAILRGATNLPLRRVFGVGAGHRAVDLHKTLSVYAPIEEVFRFWTNFQNFPEFMRHVKRIDRIDDVRSHWTVVGPLGIDVEWDAVITSVIPNEVFAWKTLPGQTVEHAGIVQFEEPRAGATRLHIRLSYNPPIGALGHFVAKLFGKDPKTVMDEDLVRMKSLLEEGKTTLRGERISRDELQPWAG